MVKFIPYRLLLLAIFRVKQTKRTWYCMTQRQVFLVHLFAVVAGSHLVGFFKLSIEVREIVKADLAGNV